MQKPCFLTKRLIWAKVFLMEKIMLLTITKINTKQWNNISSFTWNLSLSENVLVPSFRTDKPGQTVQNLWLLLEEQSFSFLTVFNSICIFCKHFYGKSCVKKFSITATLQGVGKLQPLYRVLENNCNFMLCHSHCKWHKWLFPYPSTKYTFLNEPHHEKTGFLHMSVVQFRPCCQVWRLGPLDLTH